MVRSSLLAFLEDEDRAAQDFVVWLCDDVLKTSAFKSSFFRVFFDGSYRSMGRHVSARFALYFSEGEKADKLLLEQAVYLKSENIRTILVTSDRRLLDQAKEEGIKCMWCDEFLSICRAAHRNDAGEKAV